MPRERDYAKYQAPGIIGTIFPRSIGRLEYFLRSVLVNLLVVVPLAMITETTTNPFLGLLGALALVGVIIAFFWITVIPRLRDMNCNTKLAWLCLIPGINVIMAIALLFTPGK